MPSLQYLTRRQRQILDFLETFIAENGYSPSLEEICNGMGLASQATVHVHLKNLEEKKLIRREWNRSRSIELVGQRRRNAPARRGIVELPLAGRVAAGVPIEAIEIPETIEVPEDLIRDRESFVLTVVGNSMIDEQIRDGDLVIVESRNTADDGDTVVALVHGEEATVKKFYREPDGRVRLQPANSAMHPMIVPATACTIRGVVIGLLRKYH